MIDCLSKFTICPRLSDDDELGAGELDWERPAAAMSSDDPDDPWRGWRWKLECIARLRAAPL